ncbi:MarR family transcriptional regulator [Allostella sp. ATCC 35155]|nr:MarR family transcriptional regulator [Stella sp. ATCC 35155]
MSNDGALPFGLTLEVRDACLCLHVQRAARALARRFDDELRPVGLTSGQYSLLMALNRPSPAAIREVTHVLAMDRTTLTANLKPLERRGLVAIAPDPADRRSRRLTLTMAGREALAAAVPIWRRVHGAIEARLADPDALRAGLVALGGSATAGE